MARRSIEERIRTAMRGRVRAKYQELLREVFPPDEFPKAWRVSPTGGPPGCSLAFSRALRKMGGYWIVTGGDRDVYLPPEPEA